MRRWWTDARAAAALVADHGSLWLPGALAWSLTAGWAALLVVVSRPPTVTDLTFLGARIYTSGAWPWNAVAAVAGAIILVAVAFLLVAVAEAALIRRAPDRLPPRGAVGRMLVIGFVAFAPTIATLMVAGTAAVIIGIREFNVPALGDPLLRTIARLPPFLLAALVVWLVGGVVHAAASRAALLGGAGAGHALAGVPRRLRAAGAAGLLHGVLLMIARLAYLAFAAVLLGVLWAPIGIRMGGGLLDPGTLPLLVGFVAIWLCLVLGGGALHAWGSVTWTRVLARPAGDRVPDRLADGDPHRP